MGQSGRRVRATRLAPGDIVDGRFRIVRALGRSGSSSVFEAVHVTLGKPVALKILRPELARRAGVEDRFLREIRAASQITHRNVVKILDVGEAADGLVYYVMEHLEGRDLSERLAEMGRLTWPEARPILLQAIRGLAAVHAAGVVHRDIKPANVFLTREQDDGEDDPVVKVLDFGVARIDRVSTDGRVQARLGDLLEAAWYVAPELVLGAAANERSDVYAMGVLMYQVLTGAVPFEEIGSYRALWHNVDATPRPLRERATDVPEAVEAVVMRCLATDPTQRPESMRALQAALSSVASPSPILDDEDDDTEPLALTRPTCGAAMPPTQVLEGPETLETLSSPCVTEVLAWSELSVTEPRSSTPSQRRWILMATLAGALAVALGGFVALVLTGRLGSPQRDAAPATAPMSADATRTG